MTDEEQFQERRLDLLALIRGYVCMTEEIADTANHSDKRALMDMTYRVAHLIDEWYQLLQDTDPNATEDAFSPAVTEYLKEIRTVLRLGRGETLQ